MNYLEEIDSVFAGLRNCKNPPDYLLYIGESPHDYEGKLSNVPVIFNSQVPKHPKGDSLVKECNFIPCWVDPTKDCSLDFYEGYENYAE